MAQQKITIQDFDAMNAPKDEQKAEEIINQEEVVINNGSEANQPSIEEVFKGKFASVDEFNKHWEDFEKFNGETETLRQSETSFKEKEKIYQQKLKEYEEAGYIDDEQYYKLAKLKKSNPEKAKQVERVLFGDISPLELAKLKFKDENPMYADKEDYINGILEEQYGFNTQLPDEEDDNYNEMLHKKQFKEVRLSAETEAYKKKILSELDPIEITKPKTEEAKTQEFNSYIEGWKSPFKAIQEAISELKITTKGENGETEELYKVKLSEQDKEKYLRPIVDVIGSGRYDTNEETIKNLVEMAEKEYFYDNKDKIIMEMLGKAKQEGFDYYRKKHQGSEIKNNETRQQSVITDKKLLAFNKAMGL